MKLTSPRLTLGPGRAGLRYADDAIGRLSCLLCSALPGINLILRSFTPCRGEDANSIRCTFFLSVTPKGTGSLCPYSSRKSLISLA